MRGADGKPAFAAPLLRNLRPAHVFARDALRFGKEKPPGQGAGLIGWRVTPPFAGDQEDGASP